MTTMDLVRRILAAAAIMTFGLSTAQAGADIGPVTGAKLSVTESDERFCRVTVEGTVPMTEAEAQALTASGHGVVVRLWGEDPHFDDRLAEYRVRHASILASSYVTVTTKGLRFQVRARETYRTLDEDDLHGLERDEIYAGVRLVDRRGKTVRAAETNRVHGTFGDWNRWGGHCS